MSLATSQQKVALYLAPVLSLGLKLQQGGYMINVEDVLQYNYFDFFVLFEMLLIILMS